LLGRLKNTYVSLKNQCGKCSQFCRIDHDVDS
jgi:hypothetical protein